MNHILNKDDIIAYFADCLGYSEADINESIDKQGARDVIEYAIDNNYYNDAVKYTYEDK